MYGCGVVVEDDDYSLPSNPTPVRGVSTQNFVANTRHTEIVGNPIQFPGVPVDTKPSYNPTYFIRMFNHKA